jgi:hypothetical protein
MEMLTTADMARRYKRFKRGTTEPSTKAFLQHYYRHTEMYPRPVYTGRWALSDVVRYETEKPWLNTKPKKTGGRKRNCDFELRVS